MFAKNFAINLFLSIHYDRISPDHFVCILFRVIFYMYRSADMGRSCGRIQKYSCIFMKTPKKLNNIRRYSS